MSKTVDQERADIAAEDANLRLEKLLLELLVVVRNRARGQPTSITAEAVGRGERTVRRRYNILEEMLERISRKGIRKSQW